ASVSRHRSAVLSGWECATSKVGVSNEAPRTTGTFQRNNTRDGPDAPPAAGAFVPLCLCAFVEIGRPRRTFPTPRAMLARWRPQRSLRAVGREPAARRL